MDIGTRFSIGDVVSWGEYMGAPGEWQTPVTRTGVIDAINPMRDKAVVVTMAGVHKLMNLEILSPAQDDALKRAWEKERTCPVCEEVTLEDYELYRRQTPPYDLTYFHRMCIRGLLY